MVFASLGFLFSFPVLLWSSPIEFEVSPRGEIRDTGDVIPLTFSFVNNSPGAFVVSKFKISLGGKKLLERVFYSPERHVGKSKSSCTKYNLIFPGDKEFFRINDPGSLGKRVYEISLEGFEVPDVMYKLQASMLRRRKGFSRIKSRNRNTWEVGASQLLSDLMEVEPYARRKMFFLVPTGEHKRLTRQYRHIHEVSISPHPDILKLKQAKVKFDSYKTGIPYFKTAFQNKKNLHVEINGSFQNIGPLSFDALVGIARAIKAHKKVTLSVGLAFLDEIDRIFPGRIQPYIARGEPHTAIGQGMPVIHLNPQELNQVWGLLKQKKGTVIKSKRYNYLVLTSATAN